MSYLTPDDLSAALAVVGFEAGTAAGVGTTELQAAIDQAQAEVDARLARAYPTPFPEPYPPSVVGITRDKAAYVATLTYFGGEPVDPNHPVRLRFAVAQQLLLDLASGVADLNVEPAPDTYETVPTTTNTYDGELFTMNDVGLKRVSTAAGQRFGVGSWPWQPGPGGWT